MAENDQRRLPYHFVVIALLCSSLAGYVQLFGLPTPGVTDDMGLTGQELSGNSRQRENLSGTVKILQKINKLRSQLLFSG